MDMREWLTGRGIWSPREPQEAPAQEQPAAPEAQGDPLSLTAWLLQRARKLAYSHGHLLGAVATGAREGEYVARCSRCGALAIVSTHPKQAGIGGTACSHSCRTRQLIRPLHSTAP